MLGMLFRAEDAKCANAASIASRNTVDRLKAMPLSDKLRCLIDFAFHDCANLIRCALAAGTPVDARCGDLKWSALCYAAQEGSERALKALLAGGASVKLQDKVQGCTALHYASLNNRVSCVKLLLDAGAELEVRLGGWLAGWLFTLLRRTGDDFFPDHTAELRSRARERRDCHFRAG